MQPSNAAQGTTVVIPCYNGAKYVALAVNSALEQSIRPGRVIVVDDGSTDDTSTILRAFGASIDVIHQTNQGVSVARNTGAHAADTPYILFLDADDLLLPMALERLASAIDTNGARVAYGDAYAIDAEGKRLSNSPMGYRPPGSNPLRSLCAGTLFAGCALMDRSLMQEAGGYSPGVSHAEDYDLQFRLASRAKFTMVPEPIMEYRINPDSATRNYARMLQGALGAYTRNRNLGLWRKFPLQCIIGHLKIAFYFCSEHQTAAREGRHETLTDGKRAIRQHPWILPILGLMPLLKSVKSGMRWLRLRRRGTISA